MVSVINASLIISIFLCCSKHRYPLKLQLLVNDGSDTDEDNITDLIIGYRKL